ncbi:MAG: hypothetical protein IPJ00_19065 [Saprospirales bacterium]|nr:hypothetical protein [Saprospirales bacterium]
MELAKLVYFFRNCSYWELREEEMNWPVPKLKTTGRKPCPPPNPGSGASGCFRRCPHNKIWDGNRHDEHPGLASAIGTF